MNGSFSVGWRQVGIGFMLLSAMGMVASTYSLVAVPLEAAYKTSRAEVMLSMSLMSGTCVILSPLLGNLMDRVSLRKMMVAGGFMLAGGYTAISFATEFWHVLAIFALLFAPANVLIGMVAVTVLLSRWFAERRGQAMGIAIAGIAAGGFMFSMIIQGLLDTFPWREALRWLGLVLVFWTVPFTLMVVDRPADRGLYPDGAAEPTPLAKAEMARAPVTVMEVLTDPAFWMIAVTVAIVTGGMKGMITNLAPLAIDNGVTATKAAVLIQVYTACGFISKLNFAAMADRIGPRSLDVHLAWRVWRRHGAAHPVERRVLVDPDRGRGDRPVRWADGADRKLSRAARVRRARDRSGDGAAGGHDPDCAAAHPAAVRADFRPHRQLPRHLLDFRRFRRPVAAVGADDAPAPAR